MRPHDAQARNVPVLHAVRRFFLHLGQHVADDFRVVVGPLARTRDVDGDEAELRPGEGVVEVVLEEVVFRQVLQVGVLDQREVGRGEEADVHGCDCVVLCGVLVRFVGGIAVEGVGSRIYREKNIRKV